jgi:uncharacterized membrane protein YgaE (UPF0421/DUF939 family)
VSVEQIRMVAVVFGLLLGAAVTLVLGWSREAFAVLSSLTIPCAVRSVRA